MNSPIALLMLTTVALAQGPPRAKAAPNAPPAPMQSIILDNADAMTSQGNTYRLSGHVRIRTHGDTVNSDRAVLDLDTHQASFFGNVVLTTSAGYTLRAEALTLELASGKLRLPGARASGRPKT